MLVRSVGTIFSIVAPKISAQTSAQSRAARPTDHLTGVSHRLAGSKCHGFAADVLVDGQPRDGKWRFLRLGSLERGHDQEAVGHPVAFRPSGRVEMQRLRRLVHGAASAETHLPVQLSFAFRDGVDEEFVVGQTFLRVVGDGRLAGREDQDGVAAARRLDVPRDAVADAAIAGIDAEGSTLARLLVRVPAERIDSAGERVLCHEIEMIVVLSPVHVADLENQFQGRGGALKNHRIVAGQGATRVVRATTDPATPKDFVHAKARLAAALIEAGAARRVERVDRQMSVFTFAGLHMTEKHNKWDRTSTRTSYRLQTTAVTDQKTIEFGHNLTSKLFLSFLGRLSLFNPILKFAQKERGGGSLVSMHNKHSRGGALRLCAFDRPGHRWDPRPALCLMKSSSSGAFKLRWPSQIGTRKSTLKKNSDDDVHLCKASPNWLNKIDKP